MHAFRFAYFITVRNVISAENFYWTSYKAYTAYCATDSPSFAVLQAYNIRMITAAMHSLHVTTLCDQHAMPSIATCGQQFIRSAIIQQLAGKKFHYVIILIASLFSWLENRTGVKTRHTLRALNLSNLIAITPTYRLTKVF